LRAQNLCPAKFFAFRSTFCAIQIELLPLMKPITSATEYGLPRSGIPAAVKHSAEVLLDFPEDRFLSVLRYENHMIFAIPCGMVQVMLLRH
jgi:hypothetical protein